MIKYANESDFFEVKNLFDECFPEGIAFNEHFFKNIYSCENTLICVEDKKIVSTLQRIPYEIAEIGKVTYIYGACTKKEYRNRSLMSALLKKSFEDDIKEKFCASILIPQEKSLFDYYRRFGYEPYFYVNTQTFKKEPLENNNLSLKNCDTSDIPFLNKIYEENLSDFYFVKRTKGYWEKQINLFNRFGNVFLILKDDLPVGFAFCYGGTTPIVQEIFVSNNLLKPTALKILDYFKTDKIKIYSKGSKTPFGCIKFHSEKKGKKQSYMNLMYN